MFRKVRIFFRGLWNRKPEPIEMILDGKPIYESDHRALGIRRRLENHKRVVGKR
jgi:hypothetical protein